MNIFVSNVSFHTSELDLKSLFGQFGIVASVKLIADKLTGKLRGFGFIEMPDAEQAEKAIASINNKEIEGRLLMVTVARQTETFSGRNSGRSTENRRW